MKVREKKGLAPRPVRSAAVRIICKLFCANRDRGGLPTLRPRIVDHHAPAVINEISMPVARIRAEYFDVVGSFNAETSPQHFFTRRAVHVDSLGCAAWHHHSVLHGLVARDTMAGKHADRTKSANSGHKKDPSAGLQIERFHFRLRKFSREFPFGIGTIFETFAGGHVGSCRAIVVDYNRRLALTEFLSI